MQPVPLSSFKTLSPPQKETPCLLVVTSHWPAPVAGSRSLRLSPCGCLSQWFCQWGPGHVASLTQHCFRGSPSGSGQHSVPPDVRVAFRCPVGQLCWPVHPSAHVGSRPLPAAAPCCPSPGSPGSACRPEGAGRAAAPCRLPARLETRVPWHAAAPRRRLRACVSPHGRPAAPWPGPGLSFGGPNRSAALTGGLFILGGRVCVRGVQARFPGSRCPTPAWLGGWRLCHSLDLWGSGDRRDGLLSMPGAWRTRGPASG